MEQSFWKVQALVLYRLPGERTYHQILQHTKPRIFSGLEELHGCCGFVIAPFKCNTTTPIVLVEPDEMTEGICPQERPEGGWRKIEAYEAESRMHYHQSFKKAHAMLTAERVKKMVLARTLRVDIAPVLGYPNLEDSSYQEYLGKLFFKACRDYPECYIALWHTEATGCWITATPEVLLQQDNTSTNSLHTIALAGTMPVSSPGPWSEKNRREQAFVADYLEERLSFVACNIRRSATYSAHVGSIKHLRTDFRFTPFSNCDLANIVAHLHPTPAVCGTPQEIAREAIQHCEYSSRRYYAGFSGIFSLSPHLFVSLRCMEVKPASVVLYAGGGLLKESEEEGEWVETKRKMAAMEGIIA